MIAPHTRLGPYEIVAPLGAGGMGEVYLAEDTRLKRKVALKLLPSLFTKDAARVRRFEQEARAASALNHPNIITIHEIGQAPTAAGGAHYIATEFIDGQTLRAHLQGEQLAPLAALDSAIQIAAALAAAHEAGIIHRDIKPENVMLRRDGIVKVLDFGLAKLTERRPPTVDSAAPTIAKVNTDPGTVLGTASYMSPEQARGLEVDARSDIFSLGVVLYEMLAGRAPFVGVNALEVISEILKTEPAPLTAHAPDVPAELQRIVGKALRKDREERYQHVKDLLLDLKDLRRELEFAAQLKGRQPSAETAGAARQHEGADTGPTAAAPTDAVVAQPTVSSAEYLIGEIRRHKLGAAAGLVLLLAVVAALAYGIYRFATPQQTVARFQNVRFTQLTAVGNANQASISPDGKFIAYVLVEEGKRSLWTKAIATGSTVQIISPTEAAITGATFSPDGNYVYYCGREKEGPSTLFQIPPLGGAPKKMLSKVRCPVTFSPDGRQFAFVRQLPPPTSDHELVIVNADGSGERILGGPTIKSGIWSDPAWSPDGQTIAIGANADHNFSQATIFGVAVKTGAVKPLTEQRWDRVFCLAWFGDGSGLALTAREQGAQNPQIWRLAIPGGEARRLTNDLNFYSTTGLSLTADSSALVTGQTQGFTNLYVMPAGDVSQMRHLSLRDKKVVGPYVVAWTPDGRIVYVSTASGNYDLWIMNNDGSNQRQLTDAPARDEGPAVSPDGRHIVFTSNRAGRHNLWRVDIDGSNLKQLTYGELDASHVFSPDGRWIIYGSMRSSSNVVNLWKIPVEGGSPVQLTDTFAYFPAVSPDGKLIASHLTDRQDGNKRKVIIIPFAGGAPLKTLAFTSTPLFGSWGSLRWSPDGRSLIYGETSQGGANLWRLPIDGSPPQPLTKFSDFKTERILSFDLTRDGKQFIIARGGQSADVVLISEVK